MASTLPGLPSAGRPQIFNPGRNPRNIELAMIDICKARQVKTGLHWQRVLERLSLEPLMKIADDNSKSDADVHKAMIQHMKLAESCVRADIGEQH